MESLYVDRILAQSCGAMEGDMVKSKIEHETAGMGYLSRVQCRKRTAIGVL